MAKAKRSGSASRSKKKPSKAKTSKKSKNPFGKIGKAGFGAVEPLQVYGTTGLTFPGCTTACTTLVVTNYTCTTC